MSRPSLTVRALLVAALLCGCAPGMVRVVYPNGQLACEIRGDPIGRAAIEAYYPPPKDVAPDAKAQLCARSRGGPASGGFYEAITGAVGALFGWLAAP